MPGWGLSGKAEAIGQLDLERAGLMHCSIPWPPLWGWVVGGWLPFSAEDSASIFVHPRLFRLIAEVAPIHFELALIASISDPRKNTCALVSRVTVRLRMPYDFAEQEGSAGCLIESFDQRNSRETRKKRGNNAGKPCAGLCVVRSIYKGVME